MTTPVWTFRPNWSTEVTERLSWLTDVLTSRSLAEQRRALRLSPRRSFEFEVLLAREERTYFKLMMNRHGAEEWLLPIWHDVALASSEAALGTDQINIPLEGREFVAGGQALVTGRTAFDYEVVDISSLNEGGLHLDGVTAQTWAKGSRVYPLRTATIDDDSDVKRRTSNVGVGRMRFNLVGPNDWTIGTAPPTHGGHCALTLRPDETNDLTETHARIMEMFDSESGLIARGDASNFEARMQEFSWRLIGRASHAALRDMLYSLRGRQKAIWVPSFNNDLTLAAPAGSGDTAIMVRRVGMASIAAETTDFAKDIRIELADGSFIYATITDAATTGDPAIEELTLAAPLSAALSLTTVRRIAFLDLMRLDQDEVEIAHVTDQGGASHCTTIFRRIPDTRSENPDNVLPIPIAEMSSEPCPPLYMLRTPYGLGNTVGQNLNYSRTRFDFTLPDDYVEGDGLALDIIGGVESETPAIEFPEFYGLALRASAFTLDGGSMADATYASHPLYYRVDGDVVEWPYGSVWYAPGTEINIYQQAVFSSPTITSELTPGTYVSQFNSGPVFETGGSHARIRLTVPGDNGQELAGSDPDQVVGGFTLSNGSAFDDALAGQGVSQADFADSGCAPFPVTWDYDSSISLRGTLSCPGSLAPGTRQYGPGDTISIVLVGGLYRAFDEAHPVRDTNRIFGVIRSITVICAGRRFDIPLSSLLVGSNEGIDDIAIGTRIRAVRAVNDTYLSPGLNALGETPASTDSTNDWFLALTST